MGIMHVKMKLYKRSKMSPLEEFVVLYQHILITII